MANRKGIKYLWGPFRALLRKMNQRDKVLVLSLVTGILCGLAAVLLKLSIHWISGGLDTAFHGSRWPWLFLPGLGMLISLIIVRYVVKDNIGRGVTKVLQAVSRNESKIKAHNTWSSMLTSAVTIGFGGSVGAEAPIVYTGAAIGSNLARYCGLDFRGMTLLLGCGAAGAVSGFFNAPLAGLLFTMEILFFNNAMNSVLPLMLSSISATVVSYLILGREAIFDVAIVPFAMRNIPWYMVLGVFCGLCSLYFLRTTLFMEDLLGKLKNPYFRWILCAAALGALIYFLPPLKGEGYESLTPLLQNEYAGPVWIFAIILVLKVFSMTFTNSGGGVGGTFGPTLFMGAIAGFVGASLINLINPGMVPVPNFVLVGMAGLMAGVMQAPLTAIFLIAEVCGGYELLFPLIITATVSHLTMRIFEKYSIYTKRVAASGELLTHDSDQAVLALMKQSALIETDFIPLGVNDSLGDIARAVSETQRNIFPVLDGKKRFQGFVDMTAIRRDMFRQDLYETRHVHNYMKPAPEFIFEGEPMDSVMRKFEKSGAWNLPVVKEDYTYLGFISKSSIFSVYRESIKDVSPSDT